MRYWWVNQNQTYAHELAGGYLWSPKRNSNGARNRFYDNMREVSPGDVVFSFVDTRIKAVGIAKSYGYECPKPLAFGNAGMNWDSIGWRVDISYLEQPSAVKPKDFIELLRPHLPPKYSPLQSNGSGLQSVYLAEVSQAFAETLAGLISHQIRQLVRGEVAREASISDLAGVPIAAIQWEEELLRRVRDSTIGETEKSALILARRGQGIFRANVQQRERVCRVTKVDRMEHLRASHCRPWRDSSNEQRLDGDNGLLLTPSIDHLFDRGFISFEDGGRLLISPVAHKESLQRMGVDTHANTNVGSFSEGQRRHLAFHRESIFLVAS